MNLQNFVENVQLWENVYMGTDCKPDLMSDPSRGFNLPLKVK